MERIRGCRSTVRRYALFSAATAANYAVLIIELAGTASLTYRDETEDFNRYYVDSGSACLENAAHNLYISLYKNTDSYFRPLMQYDDELIWFY